MRDLEYKVGQTVCCCDLGHREIAEIDEDLAIMTDGSMYDLFHCVEPVQDNDACHSEYLE